MKKRKTPILLLSMLLVLVGGFLVFGMSQGGGKSDTVSGAIPASGDEHAAPSADQVADRVAHATSERPQGKPMPTIPGMNTGPSIAIRTTDPILPKPKLNTSSSTSSGWYYRNSAH